jgi:hypothetical protein
MGGNNMRKALASILAAGLVFGMLAGPATAGKKKKITKTFAAGPHVPIPNADPGNTLGHSCLAGEEGVHKTTVAFKTPGKGLLDVSIDGFEGDWDLYVLDASGATIGVSEASQLQEAPTVERIMVPLAAKKTYSIVACNFAGSPLADGTYTYTYKA